MASKLIFSPTSMFTTMIVALTVMIFFFWGGNPLSLKKSDLKRGRNRKREREREREKE